MYNGKKGVVYLVLVRVVYDGQEKIIDELKLVLEDVRRKESSLRVLERVYRDGKFIDVICDPLQYTDDLKDYIIDIVSTCVYKFVINIFISKEIDYFFDNSYFFIKYDEVDDVKREVINVLLKSEYKILDKFFTDKKNIILQKIKSCVEENNVINIDGFVRFRMKYLFNEIEMIVDRVVEKHMVEKEYNEFIKLLKYFVDVQESKIDEINIIIDKLGSYVILDKNNNNICDLFLDDLNDIDDPVVNINKDDLLISGLITNSPQKIILHGAENSLNMEIIETIKQVFENRVNFCCGCLNCMETVNEITK